MSFQLPENKDQALELAEAAVDALNAIASTVGGATAASAAGALTVIRVILGTIKDGFDGKVTPEQVRKELAKLRTHIDVNDAAADAALHDKFRTEPTKP